MLKKEKIYEKISVSVKYISSFNIKPLAILIFTTLTKPSFRLSKFVNTVLKFGYDKLTALASTIGATFVFSNVILAFDLTMLLVYSFTVVVAIITGWLTMERIQYYWTHDYLDYAKMITEEETKKDGEEI